MLWFYNHTVAHTRSLALLQNSSSQRPSCLQLQHGLLFASHPLTQHKPGLCQDEQELLVCPSSSSPKPLCQNLPTAQTMQMHREHRPSVRWEGAAATGGSAGDIVLLDTAGEQSSAPDQGGAPSCHCFVAGVITIERSGFLWLLMASGDFWTILSIWFQSALMDPIGQLCSSQAFLRTLYGRKTVRCGLSWTCAFAPVSYEQWRKWGLLYMNSVTSTSYLQREKGQVGLHLPNLEDLQKFVGVSSWQVFYRYDLPTLTDFI